MMMIIVIITTIVVVVVVVVVCAYQRVLWASKLIIRWLNKELQKQSVKNQDHNNFQFYNGSYTVLSLYSERSETVNSQISL